MCLAPGHTQQGDVLALIVGGPELYILRPTDKGCRYVGDAYVFGFMDGQELEMQSWLSDVTKLNEFPYILALRIPFEHLDYMSRSVLVSLDAFSLRYPFLISYANMQYDGII